LSVLCFFFARKHPTALICGRCGAVPTLFALDVIKIRIRMVIAFQLGYILLPMGTTLSVSG
jgi:hypothetical protein